MFTALPVPRFSSHSFQSFAVYSLPLFYVLACAAFRCANRCWKKKYLSRGKDGLKASYHKIDPEVHKLEEENDRLKRIIAKQAIELELKSEL